MSFEIACCIALGDAQVYHHLIPISNVREVSKIWIIRHKKVETGTIPKAEYIVVSKFKLLRFIQMFFICRKLAKRKNVKYFVSFNPFPYGLIAFFAKIGLNKKIHMGFIGSDWYRDFKKHKILKKILKKADFITVTGNSMKDEMIDEGFDSSKIQTLPHSIDVTRFKVPKSSEAKYDCLFVGQLIHRKRIDIIIKAIAEVKKHIPEIKLCIVGRGELERDLKRLAQELSVSSNIEFVGYTNRVQDYYSNAKLFVMASDMEGFPFAVVEAVCSGLVPISTPVGTICDFIKHEENGSIFSQDSSEELAECIKRLMTNKELHTKLQNNVLKLREYFSYESALSVWGKWLQP